MRGKPPITLPDDAQKRAIASIQRFFGDELGQDIGDLKASTVLDYFLVELGPVIYNRAVGDATRFFAERASDLGALAYQDEFPYLASRHPASTMSDGYWPQLLMIG
jgi:uncharacterized protein (DUF2164 family)